MQMQVVCVLLLCFTCGASVLDSDQREILSSLFSAQMRQNKQSAPFWRLSLSSLCRLVTGDEGWSLEQEEAELSEPGPSPPREEELYGLRLLCGRLRWDSESREQNLEVPLKRKFPYILKRQTHSSKSRRPYILKRTVY